MDLADPFLEVVGGGGGVVVLLTVEEEMEGEEIWR